MPLQYTPVRLKVLQYLEHARAAPGGGAVADPASPLPAMEILLEYQDRRQQLWLVPEPDETAVRLPLGPFIRNMPANQDDSEGPDLYFVAPVGDIKAYLSDVTVIEGDRPVAEATIEVNHPLHWGGYHFYQYDYDKTNESYSILHVVSDSGLWAVYLGLFLLVAGAFGRFWLEPAWAYLFPGGVRWPLSGPSWVALIVVAMALYLAAGIPAGGAACGGRGQPSLRVDLPSRRLRSSCDGWRSTMLRLQNMFEVFLCLGMAIWPLSLFCRRLLGAGNAAFNAFLGFGVLFPAAFVFNADPEHLPPALRSFLFVPHVAAYMLSYVIMAMAAFPAFVCLITLAPPPAAGRPLNEDEARSPLVPYDIQAHRLVMLGFPLLTLGLALGSWWGKMAWGDYWNWDPKELWSLVSWLIYLAYFHFRYMFGRRYPWALSAFILVGMAAIFITLLWVNLSHIFGGGMHSYAN